MWVIILINEMRPTFIFIINYNREIKMGLSKTQTLQQLSNSKSNWIYRVQFDVQSTKDQTELKKSNTYMRGSRTSRTRKKVLLCQRLPRDLSKKNKNIQFLMSVQAVPPGSRICVCCDNFCTGISDLCRPSTTLLDYGAVHKRRHQCFKIFDPPPSFVIIFTTVL